MFLRFSRAMPHRGLAIRAQAAHTLTQEQIQLVKATAPVFQKLGVKITSTFYQNMFADHPELKNIFNLVHQKSGAQPTSLANAVFAYAANIDNLGALGSAVSRIGHKHASLQITPEQYPIVGDYLLRAVKQVLGDGIDDKTVDAWKVAYAQLADIMIGFEKKLYYDVSHMPGGWAGWRKFKIVEKKAETGMITSFTLQPSDEGEVPMFKPGQYISVKQFVPELGYEQPRQYSLSCPAKDHARTFRITVKKEVAENNLPHGTVSTLLHESKQIGDEIDVSAPMGDFTLDIDATTPVVLISGGVGLTPMLSMLTTLVEQAQSQRKISFIHAARNLETHAMRTYLQEVARKNADRLRCSVWYEEPQKGGVQGVDFHHAGRIQLETERAQVLLPNADYYLCGPVPFMTDMEKQLKAMGVSQDKIHSEVFGSDAR